MMTSFRVDIFFEKCESRGERNKTKVHCLIKNLPLVFQYALLAEQDKGVYDNLSNKMLIPFPVTPCAVGNPAFNRNLGTLLEIFLRHIGHFPDGYHAVPGGLRYAVAIFVNLDFAGCQRKIGNPPSAFKLDNFGGIAEVAD
jgi:hypothetical protein